MIGSYCSPGIVLKWQGDDRWSAFVDFQDDGFCQDGSTEGMLRTRYNVTLERAIDTLKADAERLGIKFIATRTKRPHIYAWNDGLDEQWPMPDGWRELLREQADRLGWDCAYIRKNRR